MTNNRLIHMKKYAYLFITSVLIVAACKSKKVATEDTNPETLVPEEIRKSPKKKGEELLEGRLAKQEEMYTQIGLSDEQKIKFRAIENKYANAMRSARNSSGGNNDAMNSLLKGLQERKTGEIKGILTGDQFTKYTTFL